MCTQEQPTSIQLVSYISESKTTDLWK